MSLQRGDRPYMVDASSDKDGRLAPLREQRYYKKMTYANKFAKKCIFIKNGIPELRNNGITKGKAMREGYIRAARRPHTH